MPILGVILRVMRGELQVGVSIETKEKLVQSQQLCILVFVTVLSALA